VVRPTGVAQLTQFRGKLRSRFFPLLRCWVARRWLGPAASAFIAGGAVVRGVILRDSSTWTIPIRQSDRVRVKNIRAQADPLRVELKGFDETHAVEKVVFEDVEAKPSSAALLGCQRASIRG